MNQRPIDQRRHRVPDGRASRTLAVVGALLGLLALVAVASRSGWPTDGGRTAPRQSAADLADYIFTVLVVVYALGALGLVFGLFRVGSFSKPRGRNSLARLVSAAALIAVSAFIAYLLSSRLRDWQGFELSPPEPQAPEAGVPTEVAPTKEEQRRVEFEWVVPAVIGAFVCLLALVYALRRVRERRVVLAERRVAEELIRTLDETIDDLRAADPRVAVIAAYARMEQSLGLHGLGRRRSEAPLEYLARMLRHLEVRAEAVTALTELFERAKFAHHDVDEPMKEQAIAALVTVRDDLRALLARREAEKEHDVGSEAPANA